MAPMTLRAIVASALVTLPAVVVPACAGTRDDRVAGLRSSREAFLDVDRGQLPARLVNEMTLLAMVSAALLLLDAGSWPVHPSPIRHDPLR